MPYKYSAHLKEIIRLSPTAKALRFIPRKRIHFIPGQFLMIEFKINKSKHKRVFSISSSPFQKYIEFTIKKTKDPFVSEYLVDHAKIGKSIYFNAPLGKFTFNEASPYSLFLAAGSGIAPFMSMLRYAEEKKLKNKIMLFYSNKTQQDILWREELQKLTNHNKNIQIKFTLTNEKNTKYLQGRITKKILQEYFKKNLIQKTNCYICGPPEFVNRYYNIILKIGVSKEKINVEAYN
jgi:ferredoxin-NADP reductase